MVRVLPSGRVEFAVRYRIDGKRRRPKLGEYPAVSLAVARKRARQAQSRIDNGEDPTGERQAAKKAPAAIARALGLEFRGHDLPRTAATRTAAAGIPQDGIAKVLNHVDGDARATRVYDRHSYDAEKRTALESWDRALTAILEQKDSGKVLPFVERRPPPRRQLHQTATRTPRSSVGKHCATYG